MKLPSRIYLVRSANKVVRRTGRCCVLVKAISTKVIVSWQLRAAVGPHAQQYLRDFDTSVSGHLLATWVLLGNVTILLSIMLLNLEM